jgi:hypothetical protein
MGHRGTWETSGGPTTPPHHQGARPKPGRAHLWWGGPPWPLTYLFIPISFSLPKNHDTPAQTRILAALHLDFSISLLNPLLLLRFGAFILRYVTPSIVQVEFYLVEYFLGILALQVTGEMSLHACSIA